VIVQRCCPGIKDLLGRSICFGQEHIAHALNTELPVLGICGLDDSVCAQHEYIALSEIELDRFILRRIHQAKR